MAEEKKTKKSVSKKGTEETKEVLEKDEKDILKEAEEKEKVRKEEEEEKKKEQKEQKSHAAKADKEEKEAVVQARKKARHGKKHRTVSELVEKDKEYPLSEAIELALKTSITKFDATIELHVKIGKKEKNIRGLVTLPGGVAKEKNILAVDDKNVDEIVADVKAGKINFDIMVADLKVMPKLALLAKVLGPKGLMPSPKAGTAVEDVKKAVEELSGGKIEYKVDKSNIVHLPIGKVSFGAEKIAENYNAVLHVLPQKKIETIYLTTSMGPSVKVSVK